MLNSHRRDGLRTIRNKQRGPRWTKRRIKRKDAAKTDGDNKQGQKEMCEEMCL